MGRYRTKTIAEWNQMISGVQPNSIFFVEGDDFGSMAIQFGALGIDAVPDVMKNFTANHAGDYLTDGKTFEADGEKLAWHMLNDYKSKYLSGDVRLAFFSPKVTLWSPYCPALEMKACAEYCGDNYNVWENFWFGVGDFFRLLPPLRPIIDAIPNPAYRANSVVCSQLAILCYKYITSLYNAVLCGQDVSKVQPEELMRRIFSGFDFNFETEQQVVTATVI